MHRKGFRKITAIITTVCMVIGMWAVTGPPIMAWADGPSGGGGSDDGGGVSDPWEQDLELPGDPYLIRYDTDLIKLCDPENSEYWGYNFLQVDDIDLEDILEIDDWTPIGNWGNRFNGTYDGGGYTISNLTISTALSHAGLFGVVDSSGALQNITLVNANVSCTGNDGAHVGALAGNNYYGSISNCSASGLVAASDSNAYAGGLVGANRGTIEGCGSSVSVSIASGRAGGLVGENGGAITGCMSGGTVISVGAGSPAGGLVGVVSSGEIVNSGSTGSVTGNSGAGGGYIGGLVGEIYATSAVIIENCYSTGDVTGGGGDHSYTGGLIGFLGGDSPSVSDSYSTGNVTGSGGERSYAGGLIGAMGGDSPSVSDSYSTGNVVGSGAGLYAGGLIGGISLDGSFGVTNVTKCYSSGIVTATGGAVADGFLGYLSLGTVADSYYLDTAAADSVTGTALTVAQMKKQASFVNWAFGGTWLIEEGQIFPVLSWQVGFAGGDGTEEEPYEVETVLQLNKVRAYLNDSNVHFLQTEDLNLAAATEGESNWTPIGYDSDNAFTGTYDGDGYTISNLTIYGDTNQYVGLFGYVKTGGTLANIRLEGVDISLTQNGTRTGGLAGCNTDGTVTQCYSTGNVSGGQNSFTGGLIGDNNGLVENSYSACSVIGGSNSYVGGLAGYNDYSRTVTQCHSTGSVTGGQDSSIGGLIGRNSGPVENSYSACSVIGGDNSYVGGLAGYNYYGTVTQCYSTGSVSGGDGEYSSTGGLIGENTGSVENSYSACSVIGGDDSKAGGLIGHHADDVVTYCYSTGSVSGGNNSEIGGLIGYNGSGGGEVENSYYNSQTSGWSDSDGRGVPKNTADMRQQATFEDAGWDFTPGIGVWRIMEDYTYPILQWQEQTADEDITLATIALDWDDIKGENSAEDNVTADLELPSAGTSGTAISWSADPTGYINTSTGAVTRPAYGAGDKNVTLGAVVSKAGGMSQTKEFTLMVKEAPYSGGGNNGGGRSGGVTPPPAPAPASTVNEKLEIPAGFLTNPSAGGTMTLNSNIGSVTVPVNMLGGIPTAEGKKAEIAIGQGDKGNLPDDVKAAIGDRPLISLSLLLDGEQTDWSNPDAPVTVSVPYTPTAAELANPEGIVVWYIDGDGNAVCVTNGRYDPATGKVTFDVTHFSDYAVVYNKVSFGDVSAGAWYSKAVSFIAAREITTGTGGGNFSPDAKLTRGQFIVMLMKAYEITPDAGGAQANSAGAVNFSDAGNTYYTGFLAAAKRLGISGGVGNNMFAPEKEITRQEMFTLLYNALKTIGRLPEAPRTPGGDSGKTLTDFSGAARTLSDFSDADQVASWAEEAMAFLVESGTVSGSGGKLSPKAVAARAEMAQVIYGMLSK